MAHDINLIIKNSLQLWKTKSSIESTRSQTQPQNQTQSQNQADSQADQEIDVDNDIEYVDEECDDERSDQDEPMDFLESDSESDLPELNLVTDLTGMGCVELISNVLIKVRKIVKFVKKSGIAFKFMYDHIQAANSDNSVKLSGKNLMLYILLI